MVDAAAIEDLQRALHSMDASFTRARAELGHARFLAARVGSARQRRRIRRLNHGCMPRETKEVQQADQRAGRSQFTAPYQFRHLRQRYQCHPAGFFGVGRVAYILRSAD